MPTRWSWPSPVNAWDFCGPWPHKCRSPRKATPHITRQRTTQEGFPWASAATPPRCGATLDRVTRPAGLLGPRPRPAADGGPSGGTHPRRSAGSPVGLTGAGSSDDDVTREEAEEDQVKTIGTHLLSSEVISTARHQPRAACCASAACVG